MFYYETNMQYKHRILGLALLASLTLSCEKERFINEPGNLVPKTVTEDPSIPAITANGALLHSEAFGPADSTLLICIHGGPGSDYRYMLNCRSLADHGYRVVFYDQLGSGLSQRFPLDYYTSRGKGALDLVYDELTDVIAHYRTHAEQRVYLLGHSWGAMLATAYTGKYPNAVDGLVLAEPGGLKWDDIVEYVSTANAFSLWGETLNDAAYMDQFLTGRENDHEILDYKLAMLAGKNQITGEYNTAPGSFWRAGAVINAGMFRIGAEARPDLSEGISSFSTPVLFFYSEKNLAYPDAWAQKITSVFPSVSVTRVMGVGHAGIVTDAQTWESITQPRILTYFDSL